MSDSFSAGGIFYGRALVIVSAMVAMAMLAHFI